MRISTICTVYRNALILFALVLLTGCEQAAIAPSRPVTITIGGATAMQPVLHELTTEFNRQYPTVFFDVRGGGSALGEGQVLGGRVNLGASTLPPPDRGTENAPLLRHPNPAAVRIPIGIDALAIIVHPSNPVEMLSSEQLVLLFNGRILDWQELGGAPGETALVSREEGSGARHIFEKRIMHEEQVSLTAVVMPTSKDVVEYVARTPNAVGYVSRAYVIDHLPQDARAPADTDTTITTPAPSGHAVRVVGVDGMWPVDAAIQNQIYSLSYPLYLVSRREPAGRMRQFIDFTLSPAGQSIVGRYHVRVR